MLDSWLVPVYRQFAQALEQDRLPGSVIIAGPAALGTAFLAAACAKLCLCNAPVGLQPCGHCQSCTLFEAGTHPDFLAVLSTLKEEAERGGDLSRDPASLAENAAVDARKVVRVSSMRAMSEWLQESATASRCRVAVVSNAAQMPEGAANAVLKTFEEPPEHTLIVMLTGSLSALLPTILSRAFKLTVAPPGREQAEEFLRQRGAEAARVPLALALSRGAPYGALELLEHETDLKAGQLLQALSACAAGRGAEEEAAEAALKLEPQERTQVLGEFLLEVLKYKARFDPGQLPLLCGLNLTALGNIPAAALFEAQQRLCAPGAQLASRAPLAQLRSWAGLLGSTARGQA